MNDDCYQKVYPGIACETLLENLVKFIQDTSNRPNEQGVKNGTVYKKPNGRHIDSSRRYYLVKEPDTDEFNLYVKITKGRNLGKSLINIFLYSISVVRQLKMIFMFFGFIVGFYRVYTNEDEVELLLQYAFNHLKLYGKFPVVADYVEFAQDSKYFIARERCEFISRLLHNNVAATLTKSHTANEIKKARNRKDRRKSSSSNASKNSPPLQSISSECSESTPSEYSSATQETDDKSIEKKQESIPKGKEKKASSPVCLASLSSTDENDAPVSKRTIIEKQNKPSDNHSTPIINRLRAKSKGRITAVPLLCTALSSSLCLDSSTPSSKKKRTENREKRSYSSEKENNSPTAVSSM